QEARSGVAFAAKVRLTSVRLGFVAALRRRPRPSHNSTERGPMPLRPKIAVPSVSAALALTIALSGCSGGGDSDGGTAADLSGPATAEQLTIALDADTGPINLFAGAGDQLVELVYDKLLSPSPYVDEPQPWLATDVRQLEPDVWEADLRTDVMWQDGEPFTPEDVVFSFQYMHDAPTG